ncbi:MAG: hypothetical protein ABI885_10695 [Gammaproteobacteria bacterium]
MKTRTLLRLACVNALGFSASTILPLWLAGIAGQFGMPPWFTGAAVVAQLGGAAAFNLATPFLFRGVRLLLLARVSFIVAAAAYLTAVTHSPALFLAACLVCGCALGAVLNVTNRLMGAVEHVQKGYAIFVMMEICVAMVLFLGSAALVARFGLLAVFPAVSLSAVLGCVLLLRLPLDPSMPTAISRSGDAPGSARAVLALASFALFFIGQATLNSFMPTIGQAAGISAVHANQLIGLGMPAGFVGAILARVIGERVRPIVPVAIVVVLLAAIAPPLAATPGVVIFIVGVVALAISTLFSLPYFFAQLGTYDRSGRYTAFGPAMMLVGLAVGPSSAVMLNASFGLPAVGLFSAALLVLGGLGFAFAARKG